MKYIKSLIAVLAIFSLVTTSVVAQTNASTSASESQTILTLAGTGQTTTTGEPQTGAGFEISLGKTGKVILPVEIGVRQRVTYITDGNEFDFGTKIYSDFTLLKLGSLELQAGGNVGATYGDKSLAFSISPEVVGKLFLKEDVFAFVRVEYPYDLTNGRSENRLDYSLGLGVSF